MVTATEDGEGRGTPRLSFREDLVEEPEHLRHVQLHVFEIKKVLVVFLLQARHARCQHQRPRTRAFIRAYLL